jgi:hypothetical protein
MSIIISILICFFIERIIRIYKHDGYYYYNNDPKKVYITSKHLLVKRFTNEWVKGLVYHKLYTDERPDTTFVREISNFGENFTRTTLKDVEKKSNLGELKLFWKLFTLI